MKENKVPEGFKEIDIQENVSEFVLEGCFLFNETWEDGGFFEYGNDNGFGLSNGCHYNSITGDCLYDQININGFKVYKDERK